MHPNFRWFVQSIRDKTKVNEIIVRSNLTIILANKKFFDLPNFFADNRIHIISSLPFYNKEKTDNQRGKGVFDKSILALKKLNKVGYGKANSNLKLDLVYNPSGAFLYGTEYSADTLSKKYPGTSLPSALFSSPL